VHCSAGLLDEVPRETERRVPPGPRQIATGRIEHTGAQTRVGIVRVPIVALLGEIEDTIPTPRQRAVRIATIPVDSVPVIALLAGVDNSVATTRQRAVRVAPVPVDEVPIVALLADIYNAVTAPRQRAVRFTTVVAAGVAVVAGFARIDHAVAATCRDGDTKVAGHPDVERITGMRNAREQIATVPIRRVTVVAHLARV
jgi:hypothetical protein